MNLEYKSTVLFVKNIQTSHQFYTNVLDQEVEFDFGKNIVYTSGIAIWEIDENHIIKQKQNSLGASAGRPKFELYFETKFINALYTKVVESNAEIFHAIQEENWGQRTFRFYDPDKHIIEIGEQMEAFVDRWYNILGSVEAVTAKTGVSIENVREMLGLS